MAIEVGKKKKEIKLPKSLDIFFQFTIVLFIIVGASYFFMIYLNSKALEIGENIEEQIQKKEAEIPERTELEKTAQYYFNLVEDFKFVIKNHRVASNLFDPLQKSIHPKTSLYGLTLDTKKDELSFSGEAEDFVAVGQQFLALKNNENVKEVTLSQISLFEEKEGEEKISFSFLIIIEPSLLNFNLE